MKILLTYILLILTIFSGFGINPTDTVKVYFRIGQSQFDPTLNNNRHAMDAFVEKVLEEKSTGNIEKIVVKGFGSPDGGYNANMNVTRRRCQAIVNLLEKETGLGEDVIQSSPQGIAWSDLREIVVRTPEVPMQQQVLDILDNAIENSPDDEIHGNVSDTTNEQLMKLAGGKSYKWLYTNIFPLLRFVGAISLYTKTAEVPQVLEILDETAVTECPENNAAPEIQEIPEEPELPEVDDQLPPVVDAPEKPAREKTDSRFALKTNMLAYVALMPNIEAEWKFADRWSAALEWQGAWYAKTPPHDVYRLSTVIPEVRYWVIERSRWHGMHVGVFGGAGLYDLSNSKKGHKGEGFMAGVSVGYMWPISSHLSLDAGIGLGFLRARDKLYKPMDGHYLYQLTKNINYVGPLRLKLSLVWRIPQ